MTATPRRVAYLSGTRADFGLMAATLHAIARDPRLALEVLVTGMHLSETYGLTVREIEAEGFDITARLPLDMSRSSGQAMARNLGQALIDLTDALTARRPDIMLVLGDRGEMLAATLAAIHLSIPVFHLHGGERSGTVDEPVRHAISKLAHVHLVATQQARDRLIRMGEAAAHVHVTGAPGLDGLAELARKPRERLCETAGLDPTRPVALLVFHPVLNEVETAGADTRTVLEAMLAVDCQVVALMPNADAGSQAVREALQAARQPGRLWLLTHLPRPEFVAWMACCDVMVGNSSSGIIEAATFGTPVVNVGSRQNMRERNSNVIDVPAEAAALRSAIAQALVDGRHPRSNCYGDGQSAPRVVELLATVPLTSELLAKCNAY